MEVLWRGCRFAMIGMKKFKIYSDDEYILSPNGNACVLLTFKNFRLVFIPHTLEYNLILNIYQDNVY